MIKKSVLLLVLISVLLPCAADSVSAANRRTAVRCLKLAESYLSSNDCNNALNQAELGLAYDSSVADLWYIKAAARSALGGTVSETLPLVTRALTEGEWVDYNRDGARVLYADLLSVTGQYEQAVGILDASPFIITSDAEFIRIRSYYCMRTEESIEKARDRMNAARRIYSGDTRFPRLFFKYEYDLHRPVNVIRDNFKFSEISENLVQSIADSFIAKMPEYDNPDDELEIYATIFASGERQKRMAQAFTSHGMKHPLYALVAMNTGLMSQQEAWDYFTSFADKSVSVELLEDILPFITDEITVASVKEHLDCFGGILTIDTDRDCEPNVICKYLRGRPAEISWDKENDGALEWTCICDFGVPESLNLTRGNIQLYYGTYPAVVKAVFKSDRISEDAATFNLMDETLKWSPFEIDSLVVAKDLFDFDFFVPYVSEKIPELNENKLISSCSSYDIVSKERNGARIKFSVLNGYPQTAEYRCENKVYAHAVFENGFPSVRSVDNDNDGIFETVETFGYDPENLLHRNALEQEQVMINLFGLPVRGSGIYTRMIQIDFNGDTLPDFTEEYLADNGQISSWDYNGDGEWDLRYKRYPKLNEADPLVEDAQFYKNPEHELVTVTKWNNVPVRVEVNKNSLPVTQGASRSFYWLGKEGTADDELFIMQNFDKSLEQGVSVILQNKEVRMLVVKIGSDIYGEILPSFDESEYEKTN